MKYIWNAHLGLLLMVTSQIFCTTGPSTQSFFDYYSKNAHTHDQYDQQKLTNLFRAYVNTNVLRLNDVEIKNALRDLKLLGGSSNMNTILHGVKKSLEPSITYYQQRINDERDYLMLGLGLAAAAFSIASFAITYKIYQKWHKSSNDEYARIKNDLEKMGVSITSRSENYGTKIVDYIGLNAKQPLSYGQQEFAEACQNRLVKISNDKEWAINAEIFGSIISIFSLPCPFAFLYGFLYPRHKEHYEKFAHIKEIIEKELTK